ncbi:uncharacterized protein LOC110636859 isoform X2 [Hevea brasiliensis]|uniref:uncharacterized protein LOC110636859 isoform X2 n=1 Tax=Hevea brasiliensis TaxID=3981 RepID=UPI0025F2F9D2|nr:uncharacterized protein LOC110636859 isoform X2 [Hevea brasiliensis]
MARRSRSSGGSSGSRPTTARRPNPPQPGLAFGTGGAVAHRAVDAVLGPRVVHHETAATPVQNTNNYGDVCGGQSKALQDCLNNYGSDISKCQFYMDMLQACRRSYGAALGA